MTKVIRYKELEINGVAEKIAEAIRPGDVLTFEGDLAAGKTTLIRGIMRNLGYDKIVNSPTFVIEHRYTLENSMPVRQAIHLDLYRLKEADLKNFDWDEYHQADVVTLVEWPAIAQSYLPKTVKEFKIKIIDDKTREITLPDNISR